MTDKLYVGGNWVCCFHGWTALCHVMLVLAAAVSAWIAAFDCYFVRISRPDDGIFDEEDDNVIQAIFGGESRSATIAAGIWSLQEDVFKANDRPLNPLERCRPWQNIALFNGDSRLSGLAFDQPHKVARGLSMTVFAISIPLMLMGWCLFCCVMNKTTTHVMAGISFLMSVLTALFTTFLISSLCEDLDCTLSTDFYVCIGSSVLWFFAGIVISFARDKDEVILCNLDKMKNNSSGATMAVTGLQQSQYASSKSRDVSEGEEEVRVKRSSNPDGSTTEITQKVMIHPDGRETIVNETSRVLVNNSGSLDFDELPPENNY